MSITLQQNGRRLYLVGNTYPVKDQIREAGGKWDPDRKAWYVGVQRRERAEQIVAAVASAPTTEAPRGDAQAPGLEATIVCRGTYHGRSYYVAGRVERGRTRWDDAVRAVESRDGSRVLLYFRDGSRQFWAPTAEVTTAHAYGQGRGSTIGAIRAYAERMRSAEAKGECDCSCHGGPQCRCPGFCHLHHDGCDHCGCES